MPVKLQEMKANEVMMGLLLRFQGLRLVFYYCLLVFGVTGRGSHTNRFLSLILHSVYQGIDSNGGFVLPVYSGLEFTLIVHALSTYLSCQDFRFSRYHSDRGQIPDILLYRFISDYHTRLAQGKH